MLQHIPRGPLLCAGLAVVAAPFWYVLNRVGAFKPFPATSDAGCIRLLGPIGAEDGVFLPDIGAVILSELDGVLFDVVSPSRGGGTAFAVNGSLWLLDQLQAPKPRLMRLDVPLPPGVDFRAHGLGLHGDILFVVNHADRRGGERVERFRVERIQVSSGPPLRLVHLGAVLGHDGDVGGRGAWTFAERLLGTINDVAPVGDHEFFFTQFREQPVSLDDGHELGPSFFLKRLLLPWTQVCRIYHCRCAEMGPAGGCARMSCEAVGPPAPMWNGISVGADRRSLYVGDTFQRRVVEFRIAPKDDGAVALEWQRPLTLEFSAFVDNVDATSGTIWVGATSLEMGSRAASLSQRAEAAWKAAVAGNRTGPRPYTHIARVAPDAAPSEPVPGAAVRIDPSSGEAVPVVATPLLWHVSFAGALDGKVVLGSAFDEGVLVCPLARG